MSTTYNFAALALPGPGVEPLVVVTGINNAGQVVGQFEYGPTNIGFVYTNGAYTTITNPGAPSTTVNGINEHDAMVGYNTNQGGYLLSNGTLSPVQGAPESINDAGQIVGLSIGGTNGSFLYDGNAYTSLIDPHASGFTLANGINNAGTVVGYYLDGNYFPPGVSPAHGFVYQNGAFSTLDDPAGTHTYLNAINNNGEIVGAYQDSQGIEHGLLYSGGTFTTIDDDVNNANSLAKNTELTGINDSGVIVGDYGVGYQGFVAEPGALTYGPLRYTPDVASLIVYDAEVAGLLTTTELQTLIGFTKPQYAYGQQIGVMDPVIYAYQALGAALASAGTYFQTTYGSSAFPSTANGDGAFVTAAYANVFDHSGTPDQIQAFVNQVHYFEAIYAAAGVPNGDLIARGAVFGQMLGVEAEMMQVPIVGTSPHVAIV